MTRNGLVVSWIDRNIAESGVKTPKINQSYILGQCNKGEHCVESSIEHSQGMKIPVTHDMYLPVIKIIPGLSS
jgi:hypothetical protein